MLTLVSGKAGTLFLNFLNASGCLSLIENILLTRNTDMHLSEPSIWVLSNVVDFVCTASFNLPVNKNYAKFSLFHLVHFKKWGQGKEKERERERAGERKCTVLIAGPFPMHSRQDWAET